MDMTRHNLIKSSLSSVARLGESTPSVHTWLFDVMLMYHSTDFQIVSGVIALVVPTSSGHIIYGTPSTTHSKLCGEALFAEVTMMEQRYNSHQLDDS